MVATADQTSYSYIIDDEEQRERWFESYDEQQDENWLRSCITPYIAGGIVGSISGKISGSICNGSLTIMAAAAITTKDPAKQGIIILAGLSAIVGTLLAENKLRAKCVDWLNQKLEDSGVQPNDLTKNSARISSWIGFLLL